MCNMYIFLSSHSTLLFFLLYVKAIYLSRLVHVNQTFLHKVISILYFLFCLFLFFLFVFLGGVLKESSTNKPIHLTHYWVLAKTEKCSFVCAQGLWCQDTLFWQLGLSFENLAKAAEKLRGKAHGKQDKMQTQHRLFVKLLMAPMPAI